MHYEELLGFLEVRDRELHNALNSRHYNRVEFKELADGQLKLDLNYTIENEKSGLPEGGMVRINHMKVSASGTVSPLRTR